jgi:zinc transport system substrate-binding protein
MTSPPSPRPVVRKITAAAAVVSLSLVLGACSSDSSDSSASQAGQTPAANTAVPVVANFYPVQWLAEEIGGPAVTVTSLTPAGTEPHDLALDADALKSLDSADAVLYLGAGFQPDVEKAVANLDDPSVATDLLDSEGVTLLAAPADLGKEALAGGKDPHVWLDPVLMSAMADGVAASLSEVVPGGEAAVEGRLAQVKEQLATLDQDYSASIQNCATKALVTSHAAFGYLADRYRLRQIAIAGVSPEDEPDPKDLKEIAEVARTENVQTVFFEDALPKDLAQTVADEIGAQIDLLAALEFDPRESIAPDATYISVMEDNRERIATGLECKG